MSNSPENQLNQLALFIDNAIETRNLAKLSEAINSCQQNLEKDLFNGYRGSIHYFLANALNAKRTILYPDDDCFFEIPELEQEILHLRIAFSLSEIETMPNGLVCSILTNLGVALNFIGRSIEAFDYWSKSIRISNNFGMALGNRGYGMYFLSRYLHNQLDSELFLREAYQQISLALQFELEPSAKKGFKKSMKEIETLLPLNFLQEEVCSNDFSLGDSSKEISYRQWCLKQKLFLNLLNDLDAVYENAATDTLHLLDMLDRLEGSLYFGGFYNQLKQEFVSARFLLYEGLTSEETHFSDRNVTLVNTFDYPIYSLAIEKVKLAFRSAYSLFDKIAFFLNHYLNLGIPDRNISFKTIWYEKNNREKGINPKIQDLKNYALSGLF